MTDWQLNPNKQYKFIQYGSVFLQQPNSESNVSCQYLRNFVLSSYFCISVQPKITAINIDVNKNYVQIVQLYNIS